MSTNARTCQAPNNVQFSSQKGFAKIDPGIAILNISSTLYSNIS